MCEILGIAEERSEVIEWTLRIAVGVREAKQQVKVLDRVDPKSGAKPLIRHSDGRVVGEVEVEEVGPRVG